MISPTEARSKQPSWEGEGPGSCCKNRPWVWGWGSKGTEVIPEGEVGTWQHLDGGT